MSSTLQLFLVSLITSIDNALLAGILLPTGFMPQERRNALIQTGILLSLWQIAMVSSMDYLLQAVVFRFLAILLLSWMSIQTLSRISARRPWYSIPTTLKIFSFTAIGNLDNILWLGMMTKGNRIGLLFTTAITLPIFFLVAYFLSQQAEKQQWILPLGAGMMAWAAAALCMETPVIHAWILSLDDAPQTTLQSLMTAAILSIGLGLRFFFQKRQNAP
ncbi:hypothetical protein ACOJUR_00510 [Alicyclobacillus tolerans]|uniref:hypothetical protein n=1 Tax=Alicyclobacillus tolerans TaxID=90970 RepID=UPI003B78233B